MRVASRTLVLLVLLLALATSTAGAATFAVDRFDKPEGKGACTAAPNDCSLEQAMERANEAPDPDLVEVPAGEYIGGFINVTSPVVVAGAGARQTVISGADEGWVLNVLEAGAVEVRDLTITHASGGGPGFGSAVFLEDGSQLTLRRLAILASHATGDPPLKAQRFLGSGAGIRTNSSDATLLVDESLISGNTSVSGATGSAAWGGAIALFSPSTVIRNSTITGNRAASTPGTAAIGGGIFVSEGESLELSNVTLANNTVTGGTNGETGETTEGGNLWLGKGAKVTIRGSIIAQGSAPAQADCNGPLTSLGGNVEDLSGCGFGAGDRTGANPLLGELTNNGGPTDTRALAAGSPAINLAGACGLSTDQRAVPRSDGLCDAGAYEYVPPPPIQPDIKPPYPPVLSKLAQSHSSWRSGGALATLSRTRRKTPVGTTISFTLDQTAAVRFLFTQRRGGRAVHGSCVAPSKSNLHRKPCKRTVSLGALSFNGHAGANRVPFQGRLTRSKKLRTGSYALAVSATNLAGQQTTATPLHFTIVG